MEETALLKLPYIMPAQAQKHVTHNEAIRILDALLHISIEGLGQDEPPLAPTEGERWIVGTSPVDAFAGQGGKIAVFQDSAWTFHEPREGWVVWDTAEGTLLVFDGESWTPVGTGTETGFTLLGINATADETNRLAIAADATLLTHEGAGHQLKLNKAAAGDTGSLLFQTGWSGRAEMGLAGNDDFSVKVSPDGATWKTALKADAASGAVSVESLGVGVDAPLMPLHVAGKAVFGDAVHPTRITSGTPGSTGRAFSLIDTVAVLRVWRRQTGGNSAVIELAVGDGSDNITDASIRRWDLGVTYNTNRFEIRYLTGGTLVALSIQSNGRIGIGTQSPHASAQVEVASTTRGFLPPRLTTAERNAISAPAEGLMVYNTSVGATQVYDGAAWRGSPHPQARSYTVAAVPSAPVAGAGTIIFVSDEAGGATLAFSDGTDWRRVTDRAVIA